VRSLWGVFLCEEFWCGQHCVFCVWAAQNIPVRLSLEWTSSKHIAARVVSSLSRTFLITQVPRVIVDNHSLFLCRCLSLIKL
jgi:hypothetical protein